MVVARRGPKQQTGFQFLSLAAGTETKPPFKLGLCLYLLVETKTVAPSVVLTPPPPPRPPFTTRRGSRGFWWGLSGILKGFNLISNSSKRAGSQPTHSRMQAASPQPSHNHLTAESQPASSQPNQSQRTADSQPTRSRVTTSSPARSQPLEICTQCLHLETR